MTTAKLIINGKEIEVQLTEEQAQELTAQKKVTGFERAKADAYYYAANSVGRKDHFGECNMDYDDDRYATANYYTDESLAEWCIRNDTLNRKMRRWAAEHNTEPIDWENNDGYKYRIMYDYMTKEISFTSNWTQCGLGVIVFNTIDILEAAIKEFGDEIKWLAENRPKWF